MCVQDGERALRKAAGALFQAGSAFLKNLRRQLPGSKLLIIWDLLQAHRSRLVRDYVDTEGGDIHLEFLPPYAPELNPVKYLWALSLFINDQ
jgi:transposase